MFSLGIVIIWRFFLIYDEINIDSGRSMWKVSVVAKKEDLMNFTTLMKKKIRIIQIKIRTTMFNLAFIYQVYCFNFYCTENMLVADFEAHHI